jgi:hypothetical protein
MFRVEFFVDDKRLADALRSLAGIIKTQPSVQPVVNMQPNGKAETSGELLTMFGEYLAKHSLLTMKPKEIGHWLEKHGYSKQSASYVARKAVEAGLLKKYGSSAATEYRYRKAG